MFENIFALFLVLENISHVIEFQIDSIIFSYYFKDVYLCLLRALFLMRNLLSLLSLLLSMPQFFFLIWQL